MARVCVVGTGYVGLCTGVVFAERGHDVVFVDVDPAKLAAVAAGKAHFFEPGLDEALARLRGKVGATTDLAGAVRGSDLTFLCVGTPQAPDGAADLTFVRQASRAIGAALRDRPHRVVVKSTVVPGTADDVVAAELRAAGATSVDVCSNPEFLREGSAMADARAPERVVVGAHARPAAEAVLALYDGMPGQRFVVSPRAAEMIKYAANAFLAAKVALSNELANVCEREGVDWYEVAPAVGADSRIGPQFLRAGVGFGGSCFPKDVSALAYVAEARGVPSGILRAVLRNNEEQSQVAVRMLAEELGALEGKRVALLGLAFKADTDDVRETRALPLWRALRAAGAVVVCHDPLGGPNFLKLAPEAKLAATPEEALRGADAAVVQTEWAEYRALDPARLPRVVVDGRRTFDPARLRAAGVRYRAVGLGVVKP